MLLIKKMSGNQSMTRVSSGKFDANYGIVLMGNGQGDFSTIDPKTSGLKVQGDVRDLIPLKVHGQSYLIFSRNNNQIKVYEVDDSD